MRLPLRMLALAIVVVTVACVTTTVTPTPVVTVTPPGYPPPAPIVPVTPQGYPAPSVTEPAPEPTALATLVDAPAAPLATPAVTPAPAASATPLATWPAIPVTPPAGVTVIPGQGPAIAYLRSVVLYASAGQAITLEWQSTGAAQASLYTVGPEGQLGTALASQPAGAISYTVPADALEAQRFALFVTDASGLSSQATVAVRVPCPAVWFFAAGAGECPGGGASVSWGAEQHFEGGTMLWNEQEDRIYVLYNAAARDYTAGPAWAAYTDEWTEGQPELDPALVPPAGQYQPNRGFGLVWRTQPAVRTGLGWATDPETGYQQSRQATARVAANWLFIGARHGGTWALGPTGGPWHYIP